MMTFEATVEPGASPPLHVHHEDELLWVLDGALTVRCGDRTFAVAPDSLTILPRGVPHTFAVEGDQPARVLTMAVPAAGA